MALDILKMRYDGKKLIKDAHFEALFSLKHSQVTALRSLSAALMENIKVLENQGEPVQHWDSWFIYLINQSWTLRPERNGRNTPAK